jgi:tetratricopeptide (TPR) repeat protein
VSSERERILQAAQKHVDKKRFDRAIEEYQKIVQKDPNDARTLLKIGDLQTRMQNYTDAVATYDRVGRYYADQGFALKAISVYKQIRELIKKHVPELAERYSHILPQLAEIYSQLGLTSDALAAYDEVATRMQRGGRDRDAIDVFGKMVELDATNPLPHLRLAEACCRVQQLDQAIDSFWSAGELLLKLDRQEDALKVIERILHFRQDPKYAKLAAELYLRGGQREDGLQALAKLQICFQADPKNLETLDLLAKAFTVLGQEAKATEVYKEMARIAREAGKNDLFNNLVAHLLSVAPGDEQVRALQALPAAQHAREASVSALSVQDSEVEVIEEDALVSQEAPFELNRGNAPAGRGSLHGPEVVVTDEQVVPADEVAAAESFDAQAYSRKAIIDAESFRRLKLYSKAIETLRIALEIDPRSAEVRQKLREVLLEAGDRDGAIGESITLAAMLLEQGANEHAEMLLYDVLDMEPEHPAALEMLQQLSSGGAAYGYAEEPPTAHYEPQAPYAESNYDPSAPLPSYDLEEIAPSRAMASADPIVPEEVDLNSVDDPFAATAVDEPFGVEAPLPSFPLGAEDDELMAGLDRHEARLDSAPEAAAPYAATFDDVDEKTGLLDLSQDAEEVVVVEPEEEPSEAIEEALEEAEFFTSRGLFDDAKAILSDQLGRTPNHPLLLERLRELEQAMAKSGESRTIDRSQLGPRSEPAEGDHVFDIAASLDALDELDVTSLEPEARSFANANQEVDVDQVFAKFKEGVRAQVSESDSATHYDLGVAYKEMGLLPDAISEFELAGRDPARSCMCYAMIGMIELERGELDKAAEAYVRALEAPEKNVDQEMSLYYDLGNVYEMKKSPEEALYYFKKIARRDPGYRDVKDRIAALEPSSAEQPAGTRAVNDEDEFDRAFDELFETK